MDGRAGKAGVGDEEKAGDKIMHCKRTTTIEKKARRKERKRMQCCT